MLVCSYLKKLRSAFRKGEMNKGKVVVSFIIGIVVVPITAMLVLPPTLAAFGVSNSGALIGGVSASVSIVLIMTLSYAWLAYSTDETGEGTAKHIVKSTKGD